MKSGLLILVALVLLTLFSLGTFLTLPIGKFSGTADSTAISAIFPAAILLVLGIVTISYLSLKKMGG